MAHATSQTIYAPSAPELRSICAIARAPSERLPQPCQSPVRFYISRRLKQIHPSRRRARWRRRGQSQMREDAGDGGWSLDGREKLPLPTTVRAVLDVDVEHALQQLRPTHAPLYAPGPRVVAIACVHGCGCARRRRYRHHPAIAGHFPDAQHHASGLHELGRRRWFYERVTRNFEAPIQLFNAYSFWLQAALYLGLWSFKS